MKIERRENRILNKTVHNFHIKYICNPRKWNLHYDFIKCEKVDRGKNTNKLVTPTWLTSQGIKTWYRAKIWSEEEWVREPSRPTLQWLLDHHQVPPPRSKNRILTISCWVRPPFQGPSDQPICPPARETPTPIATQHSLTNDLWHIRRDRGRFRREDGGQHPSERWGVWPRDRVYIALSRPHRQHSYSTLQRNHAAGECTDYGAPDLNLDFDTENVFYFSWFRFCSI